MSSLNDSNEEKLFQDDESFDNVVEKPPRPLHQRRSFVRQWLLPFGLHLSLVLFYTIIATMTIHPTSPSAYRPSLVYCEQFP